MATIQEQINQLKVDKQTLVDNLVAKGVEATNNETFTTLVPKVKDIQGGININDYFNTTYSGTSSDNWIKNNFIKKVPDLIIDDSVTKTTNLCVDVSIVPKIICNSNVTDMSAMYGGAKFNNLDVSGLNTSNTTNMSRMFINCTNLTNLDIRNFVTSKVNNMSYMFYNCRSLTSLDIRNFDTSNVTDMSYMFYNCKNLTRLDIRNFDFTKVTRYSSMFSGIPDDCLIIVKDDTAKTWITSKFTTLTNVKTVAELGA